MQQTQEQMFYAAERRAAETNQQFLELVADGMTREELQHCIERRPALWRRFDGWLDKLPSKAATAELTPAKLQFICTYRGVAEYEVLAGPMAGKRVRVRYLREQFYERDWCDGQPWNYTREQYQRVIVEASGIADYLGKPVTADVLAALNANRALSPDDREIYATQYLTARFSAEEGRWIKCAAQMPAAH